MHTIKDRTTYLCSPSALTYVWLQETFFNYIQIHYTDLQIFPKIAKMALSSWKSTRKDDNRKILILLTYHPFRHLIQISTGWNSQAQTVFFPVGCCMHLIAIPYFAQLCRIVYQQFLTYHCNAAKVQTRSVLLLPLFWEIRKLTLKSSLL